jgi:hypothetical protein
MDRKPSNPSMASGQTTPVKGKRPLDSSELNPQMALPLPFDPSTMGFSSANTPTPAGPSNTSISSFDLPTTGPTDISFTQAPVISPYMRQKQPLQPQTLPGRSARKKDKHDSKRVKSDFESDTPALDSIDYWMNFDDDDADKWGSFEIDFSKRNDPTLNASVEPPQYLTQC